MCQAAVHSLQLQLAWPCETLFLKTCRPWLLSEPHHFWPASQGPIML